MATSRNSKLLPAHKDLVAIIDSGEVAATNYLYECVELYRQNELICVEKDNEANQQVLKFVQQFSTKLATEFSTIHIQGTDRLQSGGNSAVNAAIAGTNAALGFIPVVGSLIGTAFDIAAQEVAGKVAGKKQERELSSVATLRSVNDRENAAIATAILAAVSMKDTLSVMSDENIDMVVESMLDRWKSKSANNPIVVPSFSSTNQKMNAILERHFFMVQSYALCFYHKNDQKRSRIARAKKAITKGKDKYFAENFITRSNLHVPSNNEKKARWMCFMWRILVAVKSMVIAMQLSMK